MAQRVVDMPRMPPIPFQILAGQVANVPSAPEARTKASSWKFAHR